MTPETLKDNPFSVQTPESIPAQWTVDLFVDSFSDFPKLQVPGHTFIHGPRGSGKSMMFRFMQPDCQALATGKKLHELEYFGAYVPVKNMEAAPVELRRFEYHGGNFVFNEHLLCAYILVKLFRQFKSNPVPFDASRFDVEEAKAFLSETFLQRLSDCGWKTEAKIPPTLDIESFFDFMAVTINEIWVFARRFIKSVAMSQAAIESYNGPLCSYHDFLLPLLSGFVAKLSIFPKAPLFLLIDDAGYLNIAQTMVLNSWIASRTSSDVSIKVSTQLDYRTYKTYSGQRVESPHDFSEINISTVYTSNKEKYRQRVLEIVERRLSKAGIRQQVEEFFPEDREQMRAIKAIDEKYREDWEVDGKGYRARDDANRYARPDFIRALGGTKKATSTYSYSGFDQLVHISSSVVRYFLEPASQMFSEQKANLSGGEAVTLITPTIQNRIIRHYSDKFLHSDMDREKKESESIDTLSQLENLLNAMGQTFHACLVSDRSERRVFSIALSDRLDDETKKVLDLGVQLGYLHASTIGNKKGTGRVPQYILSRRLAPSFNLDPTSFAGYLFVTNARLKQAMMKPEVWLRDAAKLGVEVLDDDSQLNLFAT